MNLPLFDVCDTLTPEFVSARDIAVARQHEALLLVGVIFCIGPCP